MKQEDFDSLWNELDGSWDVNQAQEGHRERFEQRLKESGLHHGRRKGGGIGIPGVRSLWIQVTAAASVAILIAIGIFNSQNNSIEEQVVEIAPEAGQSALYFANVIEAQLREIEQAQTPETAPMVSSALGKIKKLEQDYDKLEKELVNGGNTPLLLKAMVINFQTRIDLLTEVLHQIEEFNVLNTKNDEEYTL